MSIAGRKYEDGLSWASYGCSVNHSRGASVCPNSKTVSERIADATVLALLSKAVRSKNFRKWVEDAMALAAQEHARQKAANDLVRRLEKDVQAQAAAVERIGNRLIEVGASDFLKDRLRSEEAKLRDLRHALAKASVPNSGAPAPKVTLDQLLALLDQVETVAEKSPAQAREVLAGVIEPVTLTPKPEGYELSLTLRNETAALVGGRTLLSDGCGGAMDQFSPTANALYTRRFSPSSACSFPGCTHPLHGSGLCDGHRQQLRRGVPLTPLRPPRRKPKAA